MIKEFESYHGIVLSQLIHNNGYRPLSIRLYPSASNASYVVNEHTGIYLKHSTRRLSPWGFTFQTAHQKEILKMKEEFRQVFILLICGNDGIAILDFDDFKKIVNNRHERSEWISTSRSRNKEYTIKGSQAGLDRKVGKNDFPKKLLQSIKS
jgi:hypothetical protein